MANETEASSSIFGTLLSDALAFATPFAQRAIQDVTTPQSLQNERLTNASLNGSGPNDPTLARQSPLGLADFITGARTVGGSSPAGTSGLKSGFQLNWTVVGVAAVAILAVVLILKR